MVFVTQYQAHIHVDNMADLLTVRFRVGGVFKNSYISVYLNDERVQHRRKQVMAPGEMEQVILKKKISKHMKVLRPSL